MRGLVLVAYMVFASAAFGDDWVPPSEMQGEWDLALAAAMPGAGVTGCSVINSMAAQAVIIQCVWTSSGRDVGYVTLSEDGATACGWGERPEALVDDWALDLFSGTLTALSTPPCPAPVRWDLVQP